MKKIIILFCTFLSTATFSANNDLINMSYVEVNSNNLDNVGCYVRSDTNKPIFQMTSIFAANINGSLPNAPVIYFNPQVDNLLNHTNQVDKLQHQGVKVLLTLLGNHQNAGWACMTDTTAIQNFAGQVVDVVNKYHLDGIDIDDEYSTCTPNNTSMIKIARAIKNNPGFKGKILTKALYYDQPYFTAHDEGNRLSDFLDYGWEMSYGMSDFSDRLTPYLFYGMTKQNLLLGLDSGESFISPALAANFVMQNNFRGVMVYDITTQRQDYLSQLAKAEYGVTVNVLPNCLH